MRRNEHDTNQDIHNLEKPPHAKVPDVMSSWYTSRTSAVQQLIESVSSIRDYVVAVEQGTAPWNDDILRQIALLVALINQNNDTLLEERTRNIPLENDVLLTSLMTCLTQLSGSMAHVSETVSKVFAKELYHHAAFSSDERHGDPRSDVTRLSPGYSEREDAMMLGRFGHVDSRECVEDTTAHYVSKKPVRFQDIESSTEDDDVMHD